MIADIRLGSLYTSTLDILRKVSNLRLAVGFGMMPNEKGTRSLIREEIGRGYPRNCEWRVLWISSIRIKRPLGNWEGNHLNTDP
jgi:hypothetical protein